ncbi:MAG TPA: hypothetical protein VH877_28150 [Polyangia bacterium]|jgi:hypothetical protein|nr:hypothetical protein [Polyangia bacterium]
MSRDEFLDRWMRLLPAQFESWCFGWPCRIEEYLEQHGRLGKEFERMAKFGSVTPDLWMVNATGAPISADPLLRATECAIAGR